MGSFSDVIALWPSLADFAAEVGVPYGHAKQWRMRDSIPAARWTALVEAAERRGVHLTTERLAQIAKGRATRNTDAQAAQ